MQAWAVIGTSLSITNRACCISRLGLLLPQSSLGGVRQRLAGLASRLEADVLQFPVTEASQHDKVCLVLAMRDYGGNPAIDEASKARQKNPECPSNGGRGRSVV